MKLFLIIIVTTGFVATTAATHMSDAVVLRVQAIKGAVRERILKSENVTKESNQFNCPVVKDYVPPIGCSTTCYNNMTTMFGNINLNIEEGIPFDGTVCRGKYTLPFDLYLFGNNTDADVTLRCCGPKNSCIIDGGSPYIIRRHTVFLFESTVKKFILEGITFQKFQDRRILETKAAAVSVSIKHVTIDSLKSDHYGALSFYNAASVVTIEGCSFKNNISPVDYYNGGQGGVIYAEDSNITLNGNTFNGNTAYNNGGAVYISGSSVVSTCNIFQGNKAYKGGAVYVTSETVMSFANTYINNTATCAGGAIFGERSAIQSASDIFKLNSEGGSNDGCEYYDYYDGPDFGANVYFKSSVFEYVCKSPIPETFLDVNSVASDNCV